jgi:hypothetical protein
LLALKLSSVYVVPSMPGSEKAGAGDPIAKGWGVSCFCRVSTPAVTMASATATAERDRRIALMNQSFRCLDDRR